MAMRPDDQGIFPFLIVGGGGSASGVFVYDPTIAAGDLIASMTDALTSPTGDTTLKGVTSYVPGTSFANLSQGSFKLGSLEAGTFVNSPGGANFIDALTASARPQTVLFSPNTLAGIFGLVQLLGESEDLSKPAQVLVSAGSGSGTPATTALLEVQGDLQAGDGVSLGQGANVQTLTNGATIDTAGITMQPVTAAASVTGIIMQAGTFDGQLMAVPSNAAGGVTITFAARATSNVSVGTSGIIQPGSLALFMWVSSLSLWFPVVSV